MLKLVNIKKNYSVGEETVHALKGINLCFRKNEFVSILGPSGCGKTTLLNIIGGLDKYTSGDLTISGVSTKHFNDRNWDVYRNHRVGFIFQSYNLIPHQSVLGNVELALTISGISKEERVKKAKEALDKVGLSDKYYKRPNQLSGGQCQRVAIARAIVNDPEILLADEPTGALDTSTSGQIMDIIQEIAKERLVIMVTHNPELAEKYSTRIIKLLDGELIDDTNPFSVRDEKEEVEILNKQKEPQKTEVNKKEEKAKMSFFTAFRLSLQNLFTKKSRTIMTSIAGSIGIIGISLVLSISYGVRSFIDDMQDDMLSGNPITITKTAFDLNILMSSSSTRDKVEAIKEAGYVNVSSMIEYLMSRADSVENMMLSNEITQVYIDYLMAMPKEDLAALFLDYGLNITNNVYTDFKVGKNYNSETISLSLIKNIYNSVLNESEYKKYSAYISSLENTFKQLPNSEDYILSQYDKVYGTYPTEANEILIVLNGDSELTDLLLAQLGYYTQDEFLSIVSKAAEDEYDKSLYKNRFSYEELVGKSFTWYPNNTVFTKSMNPTSPFSYNPYYNSSFTNGVPLKIVGIVEPKEELSYGSLSTGFYYTEALTKYIIEQNLESEITKNLIKEEKESYTSMNYNGFDIGLTYKYSYIYEGILHENATGFVGSTSSMNAFFGSIGMQTDEVYTITLQELGGINLAHSISIYPTNFERKANVLKYLDAWNGDEDLYVNGVLLTGEQRQDITYTDALSIIIAMINSFINIITIALIGFTALSLLVSCVMIGIITYVSVVERIKEIGVIRSLGGRKKDVARLFTAETFIIGLFSGLVGITFTYIASLGINIIVNALADIQSIAIFPIHYAFIMISVSIVLTVISGVLPSRSAARKEPVVALRTE